MPSRAAEPGSPEGRACPSPSSFSLGKEGASLSRAQTVIDIHTSRRADLCTAVLGRGPGGSLVRHMRFPGAVRALPEPRGSSEVQLEATLTCREKRPEGRSESSGIHERSGVLEAPGILSYFTQTWVCILALGQVPQPLWTSGSSAVKWGQDPDSGVTVKMEAQPASIQSSAISAVPSLPAGPLQVAEALRAQGPCDSLPPACPCRPGPRLTHPRTPLGP